MGRGCGNTDRPRYLGVKLQRACRDAGKGRRGNQLGGG